MKREDIYKAIDNERAYQLVRWGGSNHDDGHNPSDWIIFIEAHLAKAKDIVYSGQGNPMDEFRKIAALCVAAGESLGLPNRQI